MSFDTFGTIVSIVLLVVSYAVYRYCCENVYLTYKDQRVGGGKHGKA